MKSEAKALEIRVLDSEALRMLCIEPNSSKFAIDVHNRAVEEIGDLSELPKLCSLDLSFNRLKALTNLGTARELRELKLYNNRLTTTKGLRANSNLEGLFLSENQITAISTDLLALVKLKTLSLKGNRIERVEHLKTCRLLVSLDLSRNHLTGAVAEGLDNLTSLETLNLSDNRLSSIGNLTHLTKLEDLNVGNNQLTTLDGQFPPNLVTLRVHGNRITDLESLATALPTLNELYVQDNCLSDVASVASRFPELESLDVRNNRIRSPSQLQALGACTALQDVWIIGNPCCSSSSYVLDIVAAVPALKTLDSLNDTQLQSHVEGLRNGTITSSSHHATPRPYTPSSSRPSTASRPGSSSGLGSRPVASSGRPGTLDGSTAPVFHKPSARIGALLKLVPPGEIEKAKANVSERLQEMKDMLQRVGGGGSGGSSKELTTTLEAAPSLRSARSSEFRGSANAPVSNTSTSRRGTRERVDFTSSNVSALSPETTTTTGPTPAGVLPAAPAPRVHKPPSCDAGTDPLDALMGGTRAPSWRTVLPCPASRIGREIETQTTSLPPAPIAVSSSAPVSSGAGTLDHQQQQLKRSASATEGIQTEPEPQVDGDAIEHEMKAFLLQSMRPNNSDDDCDNNNSLESCDGNDSYSSWRRSKLENEESERNRLKHMESPRIEPIKTAEQRQPPTVRSRQGYRSFRMPSSRPSSSSAS